MLNIVGIELVCPIYYCLEPASLTLTVLGWDESKLGNIFTRDYENFWTKAVMRQSVDGSVFSMESG